MKTTRKKTKLGMVTVTEFSKDEWAKLRAQPQQKKVVKALNIEMGDRTLSKIDKWVRAGHLSKADAERLKRETIARVVQHA